MKVYSKEIISYAFYKHVELVDFEDYVYRGWLVPDINNPKNYLILSEHRDNIPVFKILSRFFKVNGVIKEVSNSAILIQNGETLEAVNLDFVIRIREFPKNKKGKKKSIVID